MGPIEDEEIDFIIKSSFINKSKRLVSKLDYSDDQCKRISTENIKAVELYGFDLDHNVPHHINKFAEIGWPDPMPHQIHLGPQKNKFVAKPQFYI